MILWYPNKLLGNVKYINADMSRRKKKKPKQQRDRFTENMQNHLCTYVTDRSVGI